MPKRYRHKDINSDEASPKITRKKVCINTTIEKNELKFKVCIYIYIVFYEDIREEFVPTSESLGRMNDLRGGGTSQLLLALLLLSYYHEKCRGHDKKSVGSCDVPPAACRGWAAGWGTREPANKTILLNP